MFALVALANSASMIVETFATRDEAEAARAIKQARFPAWAFYVSDVAHA